MRYFSLLSSDFIKIHSMNVNLSFAVRTGQLNILSPLCLGIWGAHTPGLVMAADPSRVPAPPLPGTIPSRDRSVSLCPQRGGDRSVPTALPSLRGALPVLLQLEQPFLPRPAGQAGIQHRARAENTEPHFPPLLQTSASGLGLSFIFIILFYFFFLGLGIG